MQWCERDPSAADDGKLTFVNDPMAEVTVINASEIRLALSGADEPTVLAAPKRVTRPWPRQSHVAAVRPNAGQLQQAEAQRKAARESSPSRFIRAPSSRLLSYATIWRFSGPRAILDCIGSLCSTVRLLAPRAGHVQGQARVGTGTVAPPPPGAML